MKIYFAGSIRGGRYDKGEYLIIISYLKKFGKVYTEHVGNNKLSIIGEINNSEEDIYNRDIFWLKSSDIFVAEVTTPSHGVGYEIAIAERLKLPILCLHRIQTKNKLSAMISGNNNFHCIKYRTMDDVEKIISDFIRGIS